MTQKKTLTVWVLFAIIAAAACWYYWEYIDICGARVPIMDFFKWISLYGRKVHSGEMTFAQFAVDRNEQIQPGMMAMYFAAMERSNYQMWPMMVIGAVLQCIKSVALGGGVLWLAKKDAKNAMVYLIAAVAVFFAKMNLNQWELLSEPFELGFEVRDILFLVTFLAAAYFFYHVFERKYGEQLLGMFGLSIWATAVSLTFASAYLVGLLGAISIAGIVLMLNHKDEIRAKHFALAGIWGCCVIGTVVAYLGVLSSNDGGALSVSTQQIGGIAKGIIYYYGATLIPQQLAENNAGSSTALFLICGLLVIAVTVCVCVLYLSKRQLRKKPFPLMLVSYAAIIGVTVAMARIPEYGVQTMTSSRYCAESLFSIAGTLIMGAELCQYYAKQRTGSGLHRGMKVAFCAIAGMVIICTGVCNVQEMKKAPYRAAYQESIAHAMENIEYLNDSQLGICQAEPGDVREAVQFLKENHLSIFGEEEIKELYSFEDASIIQGISADGWVAKNGRLTIKTGEQGGILLHGYIPFDLPSDASISILLDGAEYETRSVQNGSFTMEIQTEPNTKHELAFVSSFEFVSPPDVRALSFLITSLESR